MIYSANHKEGKFYLAGFVGQSSTFVTFCDTGADLSLAPLTWRNRGNLKKLDKEIIIKSFDGKSEQILTESVVLKVHFGNCILNLKFYLCDITTPIIGTDLLRNPRLKMSLNTKTENVHIDKQTIRTSSDEHGAVDELHKRMKAKKEQIKSINSIRRINWARSTITRVVKAERTINFRVTCDQSLTPSNKYVFISLYDNDDKDFFIPSLLVENVAQSFDITIENKSTEDRHINKGQPLGEMKLCSSLNIPNRHSVVTYTADDIREAMDYDDNDDKKTNRQERTINVVINSAAGENNNRQQSDSNIIKNADTSEAISNTPSSLTSTNDASAAETNSQSPLKAQEAKLQTIKNSTDGPIQPLDQNVNTDAQKDILLSQHVNKSKIDADTLNRCYKDGITIDLNLNTPEATVKIDEDPVDIGREMQRGKNFEFWPDKKAFISQFDLSAVEGPDREKLINILLKFNHIFFNEDFPHQFHRGLQMAPIKLKMKDDHKPLKSCPPRRLNKEKLKHLRAHLNTMLARGIIEEVDGETDCHMSGVHIVIERRFIATLGKCVEKSRFVLDQRVLNQAVSDVSFPLPFSDTFRRDLSGQNFTIFSNLDATLMFYQAHMDQASVEKYFGFFALGRAYIMKRLSMGLKVSVSYIQAFMTKVFRFHKHAQAFVDDISIKSTNIRQHLNEDLPHALALCSKYNILLSAKKADLCKSDVRVLGFQVGHASEELTGEKKTKIREMEFPVTKKDAISKCAFFSYFIPAAPRISELMEPLRRLALPKVRFQPTNKDKQKFKELKEYLLDDDVGALRMPGNKPDETIIVWTDSSKHSIGCIITQLLHPLPNSNLDPTKKYLYIIACWSRKIVPEWSTYPVWLLELTALEECTRKFDWLLGGGTRFIVMTDSSTVRAWASLELVPKDVARKVLRLQRYNYIIFFISTHLNLADWITRVEGQEKTPEAHFPRLTESRIYNSKGKAVKWEKLFSKAACDEAKEFFTRSRRQELAHAISPESFIEPETDEIRDDVLQVADALIRKPDISNSPLTTDVHASSESVYKCIINAYSLDDKQLEQGEDELDEDISVDDGLIEKQVLKTFGRNADEVRNLQEGDKMIDIIISKIKAQSDPPGKTECLKLEKELQQFERNRSLFKINNEGILLRLWHTQDGDVYQLIVVGEKQLDHLVEKTHKDQSSPYRHAGIRRTFTALSKTYYAFNMRDKVHKIVTLCAVCKLNKHPRTNATKSGNQIATEPNAHGQLDIIGPINGFGKTASGNARYVLLYVDSHSRFTVAKTLTSCADDQILDGIIHIKDILCGMPKKLQMDGAIATPNSRSLQFLQETGVSVNHGMPHISRNQGKVERAISTFTRLLCMMQTENPKLPFTRLVNESTFIMNSTPSSNPPYLAPKDIHFSRAPSNFLHHAAEETTSGRNDAVKAAREASKRTLLYDVKRFMKRQVKTSATDYTSKLRPGMICLQKRTSFPASSPKKLCYKTTFDVFKITSKVATNSYRVRSLKSNDEKVMPGDNLIKLTNITDDEAIELVDEMERVAAKESLATTNPSQKRLTRSKSKRIRASSQRQHIDYNISSLFI